MNRDEKQRLVGDYANYFKMKWDRDGIVSRAASAWASDALMGIVVAEPMLAYELILAIADHDGSDEVLDSLANGPLESLLQFQSKPILEALGRDAPSNPRTRHLLSYIWEDNHLAPDVWERVIALGNGSGGHAV
jgi:hypothetical protein